MPDSNLQPQPPAQGSDDYGGAPARTPALAEHLETCLARRSDLWIFGYGSLMWNPGFAHCGAEPALLRGWHRSFCVYSHRYRGTPERPGLVLGLDRGGACRGVALRIPADAARDAVGYLWEREMIGGVYEIHPSPSI